VEAKRLTGSQAASLGGALESVQRKGAQSDLVICRKASMHGSLPRHPYQKPDPSISSTCDKPIFNGLNSVLPK
jgi:hypothetical protein